MTRTVPKPCPTCYAPMHGTPPACERHGVPPPPKPVTRTLAYSLRRLSRPGRRVARIVCASRGNSWAMEVAPGEYRCERCGGVVHKPVDAGDGKRVKVVA